MRKKIALVLMVLAMSLTLAAGVSAAVYNPKSSCHDENGKWAPRDKNCDINSCGCLYHEIERFVKEMFKGF